MTKKRADDKTQTAPRVPRALGQAAAARLKAGGAHKTKAEKQDSKYPRRWQNDT